VVEPEEVLDASLATARNRAATVLRTELDVVLKYSWNREDEPDWAADAAALARDTVFFRAVERALDLVPEHEATLVRLSRGLTAEATDAA
jgi:hypothetical protein